MVAFGSILSIAAIVTTVLLVFLTDASPAAKIVAVIFCAGTFFLPQLAPSVGMFAGPGKAVLSIVIIIYLKYESLVN